MTEKKPQCEAHIFYENGDDICMLCKECAASYFASDSSVIHMGTAEFADVIQCTHCKKNLLFNNKFSSKELDTKPAIPKQFSIKRMLGINSDNCKT
jgi:hypothetical protein